MNERIKELLEQCQIETYGVNGELLEIGIDAEKFAEFARQDEREACAKIAENGLIGHTIAKAIRARGDKHD